MHEVEVKTMTEKQRKSTVMDDEWLRRVMDDAEWGESPDPAEVLKNLVENWGPVFVVYFTSCLVRAADCTPPWPRHVDIWTSMRTAWDVIHDLLSKLRDHSCEHGVGDCTSARRGEAGGDG